MASGERPARRRAHSTVRAAMRSSPMRDAVVVDVGDAGVGDAPRRRGAASCSRRLVRETVGIGGGCAAVLRAGSRAPGADRCGGSRGARLARDLAERAGELDAGRAAADDHEGEPGASARSGSVSRSAASNARRSGGGSRARPRCVFRPGASCSHSSWPKYECVAPVATMR